LLEGRERRGREREKGKRESRGRERGEKDKDCRKQELDCLLLEGVERKGEREEEGREKGKGESRGRERGEEGSEERRTKIAAAKSLIVCCWKEWRGWEREEEGKDCRSQEFDCLLLEGVEKKLNFFTKGERRGS